MKYLILALFLVLTGCAMPKAVPFQKQASADPVKPLAEVQKSNEDEVKALVPVADDIQYQIDFIKIIVVATSTPVDIGTKLQSVVDGLNGDLKTTLFVLSLLKANTPKLAEAKTEAVKLGQQKDASDTAADKSSKREAALQAQIDDGTRKTLDGIATAAICLGVAGLGLGLWIAFGAGLLKQGLAVAGLGLTLAGLGTVLLVIAAHLLLIGCSMGAIAAAGLVYLIHGKMGHVKTEAALGVVAQEVEDDPNAKAIKARIAKGASDAKVHVSSVIAKVKADLGIKAPPVAA